MVPRPVARKRKSAQTKSQSVNPSRKRRRGRFSRKMVISSDTPAALTNTHVRKILEVSQVSPMLNQRNSSKYACDVSRSSANEAISLRQPLCCDDLTTGIEIPGDKYPSGQLLSDKFVRISNQGVDWYAEVSEPSSSDSELIAIKVNESDENQLNGLAESESQMEFFADLKRKLQHLASPRLSLLKEEAGCQTLLHRTQAFDEVMKRLDQLSETWTNGTTVEDKAQRSSPSSSPDLGASVFSNSHVQPRQSDLLQVLDEKLSVDMTPNIRSDELDRKYWYSKSNSDHLGSEKPQHSYSEELNQQARGEFSGELLRARASRLQRHAQVSDLFNVELSCSPKIYTHLQSWQQDRTWISSPPTPSKISPVRTCINEKCLPSSPFHSAVIRNDTSLENLVAISTVTAASDEDRNSTTIRQQARKKVLNPWKNFQDYHSPLTAVGFKNCLESRDDQFIPLIVGIKPNEIRLDRLKQPPIDIATAVHESNKCCWDKVSARIDSPEIAFPGSDDWKLIDEAESSAFPAVQGLDFCAREYEDEEGEEAPQTFHCGSSAPPAAFSTRDFLNSPGGSFSSP